MKDSYASKDFELFPNPSSGYFIVDVSNLKDVVKLSFENESGEITYTEILKTQKVTTFSASDIGGKGLYTVKAESKERIYFKKLVLV